MMMSDDLDVSEDDMEEEMEQEEEEEMSSVTQKSLSDLDFVAANAQAEMEIINSANEVKRRDDMEKEGKMGVMIEDSLEVMNRDEGMADGDNDNEIGDEEKEDDNDDDVDSESEEDSEDESAEDDKVLVCEEEEDMPTSSAILRTKNEIVEEKIEPVEIELSETEELSLVGEVMSFVASENTVVIQSFPTQTPLDEGSVLCLRDRKIIGKISELFGPLSNPFYIVKLTTKDMIADEEVGAGSQVFVVDQHSSYVTPQSLSAIRNIRGSDASNMWDEEIGDDEREFSDDEQEAAYRKNKKNLKRNANKTMSSSKSTSSTSPRRTVGGGRGGQYTQRSNTTGHAPSSFGGNVPQPLGCNSFQQYPSPQYHAGSGAGQGFGQQNLAPPPPMGNYMTNPQSLPTQPGYSYGTAHVGLTSSCGAHLGGAPLPPPSRFVAPSLSHQPAPQATPYAHPPFPQQQLQQQSYIPGLGSQLHQPPYPTMQHHHQPPQYTQQPPPPQPFNSGPPSNYSFSNAQGGKGSSSNKYR